MQFIGIDIGSERQMVAIVNAQGDVVVKPTGFSEDASEYQSLCTRLGAPDERWIAHGGHGALLANPLCVFGDSGFPGYRHTSIMIVAP